MATNLRFSVALHILTLLAARDAGVLTSEAIASSVDTHPVVIRRVMASLRKSGLVESRPGVNGGWKLTKPAKTITLCKVFESVQEENLLAMHAHPNPRCPVGGHIRESLEDVFVEAEKALHHSLSKQTVADILEDVQNRATSTPRHKISKARI
jgi:Rrf2 family protein